MQNEVFLSGEHEANQQEMENRERVDRYNFRHRIRSVISIIGYEGTALPNKPRIKQLLEEALILVPPFSEREEEWLEHDLQVEFGELEEGSDEDVAWRKGHARHGS